MIRTLMIAAIALLFAGCSTPSLHPFHTPGTVLSDPALAGYWIADADDDEPTILFIAGEGPRHRATLIFMSRDESPHVVVLDAYTFRLEEVTYADLTLAESEAEDLGSRYFTLAIPVHQVIRYERHEDALHVWQLDHETLAKRLVNLEVPSTEHERFDRILTGSTLQLQEFLKAHAADESLWTDRVTFVRLRPTS